MDLWWACYVASSVGMSADVGPMAPSERGVRVSQLLTVAGGSAMRAVSAQPVSGAGSAACARAALLWVWALCGLGVAWDCLEGDGDVGC